MATPLELISEKVPLKEDKSRLSVEGTLAGATLAVVLSVLWPAMAEASEWIGSLVEGPGPIEGNPPEDGGRIRISSDNLGNRPLDEGGVVLPEDVELEDGKRSFNLSIPPKTSLNNKTPDTLFDGLKVNQKPDPVLGIGINHGPRRDKEEENYPDVALKLIEDQKYIQINVNSPIEAIGSSVYETASSNINHSIQGLNNATIEILPTSFAGAVVSYSKEGVLKDTINMGTVAQNLLRTGNLKTELKDTGERPSIGVNTTGDVNIGAKATHADGIFTVASENHGALQATLTSFRNAAEYIQIKANDAIRLLGQVAGQLTGQGVITTTGIKDNVITTGIGNDSLLIAGNTTIDGHLKAGDEGIDLQIGVNTIGVDGSTIRTWAGNDQIVIAATMNNQENSDKTGVSIELDETWTAPKGNIDINLTAAALNQSAIYTGKGNDKVIVQAGIDEYLAGQVNSIKYEDGDELRINVNKSIVGMQDSILNTGEGDDQVLIRGDVNQSIIDTGPGNDQVIIQGSIEKSSINVDQDDVLIIVPLIGRTETLNAVQNTWNTRDTSEVSLVLGDGGNNIITSTGEFKDNITIMGLNTGKIYNTAFTSVESFELGSGSDIVTFEGYGRISGRLEGGDGYDTLSFKESALGLNYFGGETRIDEASESLAGGGVYGFEEIIGSNNNDLIMLSNNLNGEKESIRKITLGTGQDIIAFNGIESLKEHWDGIGGSPVIENLDLGGQDQVAYRYGKADDQWFIQKNIIALPDDLIRNGVATADYGLSVGITDGSGTNGYLYLNAGTVGNIELAKLKNVQLPSNINQTT